MRIAIILIPLLVLTGCAAAGQADPAPTLGGSQQGPSQADAIAAMNRCLEDAGWEIDDPATGSVIVPEEQLATYNVDLEACSEQLAEQFGYEDSQPLSDEELADLYQLEVEAADCLRGLGYSLETPSLQTFIDTYPTDPFIAHQEIGTLSQAEYQSVTEQCPPAAWTYQR